MRKVNNNTKLKAQKMYKTLIYLETPLVPQTLLVHTYLFRIPCHYVKKANNARAYLRLKGVHT